ncbi:c-type cytochrome [Scytonema sp. NUACC21]
MQLYEWGNVLAEGEVKFGKLNLLYLLKGQTNLYNVGMKKLINFILVTLIVFNLLFIPTALAADTANGAKIFSVNCAGCHINGSNIVRRGKNLKLKALRKYGMDSVEAISAIVTNGKNNMSAYKDRLTEQEIQDVSAYVLEQAEKGWR